MDNNRLEGFIVTKKELSKDHLYSKAIDELLKAGIEKIPLKYHPRLRVQIDAVFHAYEIKLITHSEAIDDAVTAGRVTAFDIKREKDETKT